MPLGLVLLASCGEENIKFPGAKEDTPTPTAVGSVTATGTPMATPTATPTATATPCQPCGMSGPCCPPKMCTGGAVCM